MKFLRGKNLRRYKLFRSVYSWILRSFFRKYGFIVAGTEGYSSLTDRGQVKFWPYSPESSGVISYISDHVDSAVYVVLKRLEPDSIFVDVGAHEGLYSLYASRIITKGNIIAFEPEPKLFRQLRYNMFFNGAGNSILHRKAVLDREKKVTFYLDPIEPAYNSIIKQNLKTKGRMRSVTVDATTLDKCLIEDERLNRVDFVKIDAEGADGFVVKGMKNTIERFRPHVLMEMWPEGTPKEGPSPGEIFSFFSDYGYTPFLIRDSNKPDEEKVSWDELKSMADQGRLPKWSNLLLERPPKRAVSRATNNRPLFTVSISNYNYSSFLEEALSSVINQTLYSSDKVEIIITDDGSDDNSPLLINAFAKRHGLTNLFYLYKRNLRSPTEAWNIAIKLARGRYLAILDADDVWYPEKLDVVRGNLTSDTVMVSHDCERLYGDGTRVKITQPGFKGYIGRNRRIRMSMRGKGGSQLVFRTDTLRKITPHKLPYMPDAYYQHTCPLYGRVVAVNEILSVYRQHRTSFFASLESYRRKVIESRAGMLISKLEEYYTGQNLKKSFYNDLLNPIRYTLLDGGRSKKPFPYSISENLKYLRDIEFCTPLRYRITKALTCYINKGLMTRLRSTLRRQQVQDPF